MSDNNITVTVSTRDEGALLAVARMLKELAASVIPNGTMTVEQMEEALQRNSTPQPTWVTHADPMADIAASLPPVISAEGITLPAPSATAAQVASEMAKTPETFAPDAISATVEGSVITPHFAATDPMAGIAASVQPAANETGWPDPPGVGVQMPGSGGLPPVVTAAPPAPVITTPPAPGVELDGEGLPWDKRIHASTKTRRQSDNTWKLLKGADPAMVEMVKNELRNAMMGVPITPAPALVAAPPPVTPAPVVTGAQATAPVPQPPAVGATVTTFPDLVQAITNMQNADKITHLEVVGVCNKYGLASLPLIIQRPDAATLIPQIFADLEAIWRLR